VCRQPRRQICLHAGTGGRRPFPEAVLGVIDSALLGLPEFEPGSVWLVGAGPGDPGLLSALALHALARADVVAYDALVDARILRLVRSGATLDYAGKRGGRPSPSPAATSPRPIGLA